MILLCLLIYPEIIAQSGKVPPFRIVQSSGKAFKAENLPKGKPIILIYFSPDCEECQQLTKELLARINEFRNVSVAMITYQSVENVSIYVEKNNLKNYSNFFVGTEGNYLFVKNYYDIEHFPFVTLYSKNGDLIKKYKNTELNVNALAERLKVLL